MKNIDYFENIKVEMAIADYNQANSWDNKFFKKKACENLDKVLANNFLELCEAIREQNSASEMEDI